MGSRTKYYTDLQAAHLFTDDDDLFFEDIKRIITQSGSFNVGDIGTPLITDSTMFFNEEFFKTMGVTAEMTMIQQKPTEETVRNYIRDNLDAGCSEVRTFFYTDANGKKVDPLLAKVDMALYQYPNSDYCPNWVMVHQDLESGHWGTREYGFRYYKKEIDGFHYELDVVYKDGDVLPNVVVSGDDEFVVLKKLYTWHCTPPSEDESCDDPYAQCEDMGDRIQIALPKDERTVMAVYYKRTDGSHVFTYIYDEDIVRVNINYTAFVLPLKSNGSWVVDEDDNRNLVFNRFGLGAEGSDGSSLENSLNNSQIKDAFITYSIEPDDEDFGWLARKYYGGTHEEKCIDPKDPYDWYGCLTWSAPPGTEVIIHNDDLQINYEWGLDREGMLSGEPPAVKMMLRMNRNVTFVSKEDDDGNLQPFFILPVDELKHLGMRDKFKAYKKMFNLFAYAEQKQVIKWYQTTFFRMVFFIISIVVMVWTGIPATKIALAVALQVGGYALASVDPRIAAVVGVIVAIYTFNPSAITTSAIDVGSKLVNTVNAFQQVAFRHDLEDIKNDVDTYSEETREMAETLDDLEKQGVYVRLNSSNWIDFTYNMAFNAPYIAMEAGSYDNLYGNLYDYDKYNFYT